MKNTNWKKVALLALIFILGLAIGIFIAMKIFAVTEEPTIIEAGVSVLPEINNNGGADIDSNPDSDSGYNSNGDNNNGDSDEGDLTSTEIEEPPVYNFTLYMESAQNNLKAGDTLNVDIMLAGDLNYTQVKATIAYDAAMLEYTGHTNLAGLLTEVKKEAADKISIRSVSSIYLTEGASCEPPLRVATLKFTIKSALATSGSDTDLTFASITVSPTAGVSDATTAPAQPFTVTLNK